MRKPAPYLILLLLIGAAFTLATMLHPHAITWSRASDSDTLMKVLLGDGRRLFANHFFIKADVYFHSGYYPSIFDRRQAPTDSRHMTEADDHGDHKAHNHDEHDHHGHEHGKGEHHHQEHSEAEHDDHNHGHQQAESEQHEDEHVKQMDFLKEPRDWIERFGRKFMVSDHSHLEGGGEREMLPWLRISAELDPQRIQTYTVAAFWLRSRLNKVAEAETFLREGLKANPDSYEILFELGRLYYENHHDVARARNVWEASLRKWTVQEAGKKEPNLFQLVQIAVNLSRLEEKEGNLPRAIEMLRIAVKGSPNPANLNAQIEELQHKLAAQGAASAKAN